jgi:hypothetical protein
METFEKIRDSIMQTGANVFRIALYDGGEWRDETLRPVCACLNCYSLSKNLTATAIGIAQDMSGFSGMKYRKAPTRSSGA